MSLLFPLYLAGLVAIGAPIVFHLIRRTPSGRVPFSTLMFLRTSPPRMVKRKSLENLPLLLLRAAILALLALAFARPFLRGDEPVAASDGAGEPFAVLVDTSASMRALWDDARREALAALADAPAGARVSLASFDRELRWHVRPDDEAGELGPAPERARAALEALAPGWGSTELGAALVAAADALSARLEASAETATLVLVTDLQAGAHLTGLDERVWPTGVRLQVRPVGSTNDRAGNAGLHRVPRERGDRGALAVRVTSSDDTAVERFELRWSAGDGAPVGEAVTVFCPPGESRVVRAPERPPGDDVDRLVLSGDARPFDNVLYDLPPRTLPLEVPTFGAAAPAPRGLEFFLGHAAAAHPTREVSATSYRHGEAPALDPLAMPLVVLRVDTGTPADAAVWREHARSGGVVLAVLESEEGIELLRALLDDPALAIAEDEAPRDHFLLGEIDFDHPLFQPFADARYRNFTGVRFWKRRHLETAARVLARFEDGAPWLVERSLGAGRVLAMTSGWAPEDSDLARSTRFAPLIQGLLRLGDARLIEMRYRVGDPGVDTSTPGHHVIELGGREVRYTVELDPEESRTEFAGADVLDRFDVPVSSAAATDAEDARARREQVRELEKRQQLWRWLVLSALAGLLVETLWAGRLARRAEDH